MPLLSARSAAPRFARLLPLASLPIVLALSAAPAVAQAPSPPLQPGPTRAAPTEATRQAGDSAPIALKPLEPGTGLHELSPVSMFMSADIVVKLVMSVLALASLASWTVLIAKGAELTGAGRSLRAALKRAAAARSLQDAQDTARAARDGRSVFSRFLAAAALEAELSRDADADRADGVRERAASAFAEITRGEARSVRRGLGLLATIGSVAPFVGLFGTVWGIMNAFIGISKAQTTNLAVVAPGIAEALLATAVGLVAAIPAVVIYNHFSRQVRGYLDVVAGAAGAAGRLLSRDLDRRESGRDSAGTSARRFAPAAE